MKSVYCFDLDETLCSCEGENYELAYPIVSRIDFVNKLFESGHIIKIFTARGSKTGIDWTAVTLKQLSRWEINYHELIFGKPYADYYIDDKGISDQDFFREC
jgi:hypothetical protein